MLCIDACTKLTVFTGNRNNRDIFLYRAYWAISRTASRLTVWSAVSLAAGAQHVRRPRTPFAGAVDTEIEFRETQSRKFAVQLQSNDHRVITTSRHDAL